MCLVECDVIVADFAELGVFLEYGNPWSWNKPKEFTNDYGIDNDRKLEGLRIVFREGLDNDCEDQNGH